MTNKVYLVSEEVLRQVLDALENIGQTPWIDRKARAVDSLRTILASEPQEPVIWKIDTPESFWFQNWPEDHDTNETTSIPLYRKDI